MSAIPAHPDDVTPDWLSKRTGSMVESVAWEPIGTGQVGDSVRFHLTHANGSASTLAAKFPAANSASRATAAMLGLYTKEVRFYAELAPQLAMRSPEALVAEVSEDGTQFILLFEDLGPARGGNQIAGCSAEDARAAIRQSAAIHAPSWHNEAILFREWIQPSQAINAQVQALYPQAQRVFAERYADMLEPEYLALAEEVADARDLFVQHRGDPQCVVHGDFRLDNMLFDIKGGAEPIAILDWQTVTIGKAMTDIGYFLGTGIGDELRRAHEDELLDLYCTEMSARGVALTREDIWHDYRVGALHGLTTAVFSAAFVERTERGDANFLSMARGAAALALEHDSLAALKETA